MSEIDVSIEHAAEGDGRALLDAMSAELDELYRDRPGTLDSHPVSVQDLSPPAGAFIVLRERGEAIACGGVKRLEPEIAEIKRMYVGPSHRGRGIARRLLAELEGQARRLGYAVARLDTGPDQPAARRLYESSGYRPIEPYNDNPYAAYWFEKELQAAPPGPVSR